MLLVGWQVTDMTVDVSEGKVEGGDDLIDIDKLLDDDTFMSIAFDWADSELLYLYIICD